MYNTDVMFTKEKQIEIDFSILEIGQWFLTSARDVSVKISDTQGFSFETNSLYCLQGTKVIPISKINISYRE